MDRLEEERDNLILKGSHAMCINQLEQQERELQMCKQEHDLDLRTVSTLKLELDAVRRTPTCTELKISILSIFIFMFIITDLINWFLTIQPI